MFKKLLLGIGLFGLSIASAKSYSITLSEPYTVGTTKLTAGNYKMVVDGSSAVLEDAEGKVQAKGALENQTRKFDATAVLSTSVKGMPHLQTIELGGTRFQVDFK